MSSAREPDPAAAPAGVAEAPGAGATAPGMRINVAALLRAARGSVRTIGLDEPLELGEPDAELVTPVRGHVQLLRDHAGILVSGTLVSRVRQACARCLEPAETELEIALTEHFRPSVTLPEGPPIQPDPDEEDEPVTRIDARHVLDLGPVVWQNFILALPNHPLCRPDCAGLCPICGANRNQVACACQSEPDPRWAGLPQP